MGIPEGEGTLARPRARTVARPRDVPLQEPARAMAMAMVVEMVLVPAEMAAAAINLAIIKKETL